MADRSAIEWTDATWNPVTGCTPVSPGCDNCYAKAEHDRRNKAYLAGKKMAPQYAEPFDVVQLHADRLDQPLRWRKPRRIFVCSGADVFNRDIGTSFSDLMFAMMAIATHHTFIVLTKRAHRMVDYLGDDCNDPVWARISRTIDRHFGGLGQLTAEDWPLPNVHVGVSVENQQTADERIPLLLETPAAVRFVSYEPALGPVKFRHEWFGYTRATGDFRTHEGKQQVKFERDGEAARLDGVICGGESGPNARPMHPDWARKVRDQCAAVGVPFFFKQHGEWIHASQYTRIMAGQKPFAEEQMFCEFDQQDAFFRVGKKAAGRILDGRVHDDLPGQRQSQNVVGSGRRRRI